MDDAADGPQPPAPQARAHPSLGEAPRVWGRVVLHLAGLVG